MSDRRNKLNAQVYRDGLFRIIDITGEFTSVQDIQFSTGYPGGLFLAGSFYVPRKFLKQWQVEGAQRVVIRNGATTVYEGYISQLENIIDGASQGVVLPLTGAWDTVGLKRLWDKPWSDNRNSDEYWRYMTDVATYTGADKCNIDRQTRLRFMPKAEAWTNGQFAAVRRTVPVGETIKKITYDYALAEGGQAWEIAIRNVGTSTDVVSITASATGTSQTHTFATPTQAVELRFYARADQTPTSDGTYYGQFSNVVIYTETSAIDITEVATDIVGKFSTEINSDVTQIASLTQTLTPFISDDLYVADILSQAAEAGDGSGGKIGYGFLASEDATSRDGKPVLFVEAYPVLTDSDYTLRLDEENIIPPVTIVQDFSQVFNDIAVSYQDENGYTIKIVSASEATLTDATSVAAYGTRQYPLSLGYSTAAVALENGVRFLAAHKDPQYIVTSPITVTGYIRSKQGEYIPSSQIRAGKRLKVENYNPELILLITGTSYDDVSEQTSMSFGYQPEPWLEMLTAPARTPTDNVPGSSGGGGGDGGRETLNWKRKYDKEFQRLGINPWTDKRSKKDLIALARKERKRRG